MANKGGHRRFGNIRQLPSGRYQIRYPGPDGRLRTGDTTYATKTDASAALVSIEAKLMRGEWTDPARGKVRLDEYATRWITERAGLRPRTVELYRWLFKRYIAEGLGGVPLGRIDTAMVREWRANLLAAGVSQTMAAKAYRLLRAVLMTAAEEDRIIPRNPCRIRGAQDEQPAERPVLTVPQVYELAAAVPKRFRALVLVVTFGSLRWGEVTALRRRDVDTKRGRITVRQAYVEQSTGELVLGPPKSSAGRRTVTLPAPIVPILRQHLREFAKPGPDALVFAGMTGVPLRRSNFNKATHWGKAVADLGVPGLHFHDLRHTGNTLAAQTPGATLRDLMNRMGHDSMRAALIYQHATNHADQGIADALSAALLSADEAGDVEDQDDDESAKAEPETDSDDGA